MEWCFQGCTDRRRVDTEGEAVDVQDSGAVEVDAVEVGADLVAGVDNQYGEAIGSVAHRFAHLGPYLLW